MENPPSSLRDPIITSSFYGRGRISFSLSP
jgi:hypothetical protein